LSFAGINGERCWRADVGVLLMSRLASGLKRITFYMNELYVQCYNSRPNRERTTIFDLPRGD
jgi:hypothetical protein